MIILSKYSESDPILVFKTPIVTQSLGNNDPTAQI